MRALIACSRESLALRQLEREAFTVAISSVLVYASDAISI